VPAALGPGDYGTLALMLGVATIASAALALGGPAAVSMLVSAAPADRRLATARALALRGLAWRELAVGIALAIALAAGAPPGAALLLGLAAALDGAATSATQATLAAGWPWAFSLRWPVQNCALVVAALALQPGSAEAAAGTLAIATLAAAIFAGSAGVQVLREKRDAPAGAGNADKVGASAPANAADEAGFGLLPGEAGALAPVETAGKPRFSAAGLPAAALAWRLGLAGGLQQLQQRGAVPVAAALGVGSVQTGNAAIAVGAAVALVLVVVQLFQVELPGAARRVAAGDHLLVRDRATQLALGSVAAAGAIALAGVVLGPLLIDWILGTRFADAGDALAPALAAVPLAPLAALGANHALLAGQPNLRIVLSGTGAAAFSLAAVLLLSSGSTAYDVALSTIAGAAAAAAAAALYVRPPVVLTAGAAGAAALVWAVGALVS
jgi:hypothetical protein